MAKLDPRDVAKQNGFDASDFLKFIYQSHRDSLTAFEKIKEQDVERIIAEYGEVREQARIAEEAARIEEEKKQKALASMLITSGFSFEGKRSKGSRRESCKDSKEKQ